MKTILDICQEFNIELNRHGRGKCPIHNGNNTSAFSIKGDYFKCYSCGISGDVYALYMKLTGCNFPIAKKYIDGESFSPFTQKAIQEKQILKQKESEKKVELLQQEMDLIDSIRDLGEIAHTAMKYAKELKGTELGWEFIKNYANADTLRMIRELELNDMKDMNNGINTKSSS